MDIKLKPWQERLRSYTIALSGGIISLLALFVLVGWVFAYEPLIRVLPRLAVMTFNTALLLFLIGISQLLLLLKQKLLARILLGFVLVLSVLIAFQHIFQVSLGIDQLFWKYNLKTPMQYPGRTSLNTSICTLMLSVSWILFSIEKRSKFLITFLLILISLIISISATSLFSYVTGVATTLGWGTFSHMVVHTAICTLLSGAALGVVILIEALITDLQHYTIPTIVTIAVIVGALLIWQSFESRNFTALKKLAEKNALFLKYAVEEEISQTLLAIQRMGDRLDFFPKDLPPFWQQDAANYLEDIPYLLSLGIYDKNLKLIEKQKKIDSSILPSSLSPNEVADLTPLSGKVYFDLQKMTIFIYTSLKENNNFQAVLVGVISTEAFLNHIIPDLEFANYSIDFLENNKTFYHWGPPASNAIGSAIKTNIDPDLLSWTIDLWITSSTLFLSEGGVPRLFILITGAVFSILAFSAAYLGTNLMKTGTFIAKQNTLLKEANQKAEQAAQAKGVFLATMSHEIRTPLNAIIGTIDLLSETNMDESQKKYTNRINHASKSLLNLISDILDYSKIESGSIDFQIAPFSMEDMIREILINATYKASSKPLELVADIPPEPLPEFQADQHRLQQIVSNFVNNAIKFTEKGHILLRMKYQKTSDQEAKVRFEVEDTGMGVSPEDAKKLFQRFSQVQNKNTVKSGGVGLGLSICKRLAELMQGQVGIQSVKGQGSTFWVEIPIKMNPSKETFQPFANQKTALVLDPQEKEKELMKNWMQSWQVKLQEENNSTQPNFVICTKQTLEDAKKRQAPIIYVQSQESEAPPQGISQSLTRPILPRALYQVIQQLTKG